MAISDKIKEYRIKRGMTQAQLAEILGVTPQAISKWEKGTGSPDLSAICPLADALKITTDDLLEHNKKYYELNNAWWRLMRKCDRREADYEDLIALDNEIIAQYPNDTIFLWRRVCDEFKAALRKTSEQEKQALLACCEEHCTELIEKFPDHEEYKHKMVEILMEYGRTDEAIAYAHGKCKDPQVAMKKVLRGDDLRRLRQQLISDKFCALLREMFCDDLDILQSAEDIIRAVFPDGNYQWYADHLMIIEQTRAEYYANRGNNAEAMKYLYRALDVAKEKFINTNDKFTNRLFDELQTENGAPSLIVQLYWYLSQPQQAFESLYQTDDYQKLLEKIKSLI